MRKAGLRRQNTLVTAPAGCTGILLRDIGVTLTELSSNPKPCKEIVQTQDTPPACVVSTPYNRKKVLLNKNNTYNMNMCFQERK